MSGNLSSVSTALVIICGHIVAGLDLLILLSRKCPKRMQMQIHADFVFLRVFSVDSIFRKYFCFPLDS